MALPHGFHEPGGLLPSQIPGDRQGILGHKSHNIDPGLQAKGDIGSLGQPADFEYGTSLAQLAEEQRHIFCLPEGGADQDGVRAVGDGPAHVGRCRNRAFADQDAAGRLSPGQFGGGLHGTAVFFQLTNVPVVDPGQAGLERGRKNQFIGRMCFDERLKSEFERLAVQLG